jgi:nonspecific dipeptidase
MDNADVPLPPVLQVQFGNDASKPTVCTYGYLDVEPVVGTQWNTDPFEMTEAEQGKLFGAGISANKAPVSSWLCVVEAYKSLGRELPVNLKMIVEGMKESGSEGTEQAVVDEAKSGNFFDDVDTVCISANHWLGKHKPCVTYGLRGVCYFTCEVVSGDRDLHSGVFGGTVREAMSDVAILMTKLVDRNNKIMVSGIYNKVDKVNAKEKGAYEGIDFNLQEYGQDIGLFDNGTLVHDNNTDSLMSRWRNPSLSMHGIEGAFSGPGEKSIIPRRACLKFSISLVPGMDYREVKEQVEQYLQKEFDALGSGNALKITMHHGCDAWLEDFNNTNFECAKAACKKVYGVDPDLTREGASVPITLTLAEACQNTRATVCMIPLGASDDGPSAANEKYNVSNLTNGIKTLGMYLEEVAEKFAK